MPTRASTAGTKAAPRSLHANLATSAAEEPLRDRAGKRTVAAMESAPYIVFAIVVALFVALLWLMRAPRSGETSDASDAAEVDRLQRENDRAVTGIADLNDEARFRRLRAGEEARRPPPRP